MLKRIGIVVCILLVLLLSAPALAYDTVVRSAPPVDTGAYPPPDAPLCTRVPDTYFDDAVLIGCSLMTGVELSGALDHATFVAKIGMSPKGAMNNRNFRTGPNSEYITMADYVISLSPRKLYIMLGSNGVDIKLSSDVLPEMNELLNHLIVSLPDTLIYLISIPPVTPNARERAPYLSDGKITAYNQGLEELAALHNIYFLDVYSLLVDEHGHTEGKYAASDGYHLQSAGYQLLAEYLYTHALPVRGELNKEAN